MYFPTPVPFAEAISLLEEAYSIYLPNKEDLINAVPSSARFLSGSLHSDPHIDSIHLHPASVNTVALFDRTKAVSPSEVHHFNKHRSYSLQSATITINLLQGVYEAPTFCLRLSPRYSIALTLNQFKTLFS